MTERLVLTKSHVGVVSNFAEVELFRGFVRIGISKPETQGEGRRRRRHRPSVPAFCN